MRGEVRAACWMEIDRNAALWTVPAERMKMCVEHHVPWSKQALEVLDKIEVFSGGRELVLPSPQLPQQAAQREHPQLSAPAAWATKAWPRLTDSGPCSRPWPTNTDGILMSSRGSSRTGSRTR